MHQLHFLLFTLFFFTLSFSGHTQEKEKKKKDFIEIKTPAILHTDSASMHSTGDSLRLASDSTGQVFADSLGDRKLKEKKGIFSFLKKERITDATPLRPNKEIQEDAKLTDFTRLMVDTLPAFAPLSLREMPSMLREDTSNYDAPPAPKLMIISEEMAIDCVWVTLREYYATWDSETINPYEFKPEKFKDSLMLTLYEEDEGRGWAMPLDTAIENSPFGMRGWRWHHGIDLDLNIGDPVYAAFDGIVRISKRVYGGYGQYVVIRHYNGLETLYGHLSRRDVEVGSFVKAGEKIGLGGNSGRSTGPHLHFEVRYAGSSINPKAFYDFAKNEIKQQFFLLTPEHFKHFRMMRQTAYHRVRSGDSLWKIARRYRTSISRLCTLNGISRSRPLQIGQRIRVR